MERKYICTLNGFYDFQKYFLLNRSNYPFNSPVTSYHFFANLLRASILIRLGGKFEEPQDSTYSNTAVNRGACASGSILASHAPFFPAKFR